MGRYIVKRTYPQAKQRIEDVLSKHATFKAAAAAARKWTKDLKSIGATADDIWITDTLEGRKWIKDPDATDDDFWITDTPNGSSR